MKTSTIYTILCYILCFYQIYAVPDIVINRRKPVQGLSLTITCTSDVAITGVVTFRKDGVSRGGCLDTGRCGTGVSRYTFTQNRPQRTTTLTIDSVVSSEDSGTWTCIQDGGQPSAGLTLSQFASVLDWSSMTYNPSLTSLPSSVTPQDTITVTTTTPCAAPAAVITWTYPQGVSGSPPSSTFSSPGSCPSGQVQTTNTLTLPGNTASLYNRQISLTVRVEHDSFDPPTYIKSQTTNVIQLPVPVTMVTMTNINSDNQKVGQQAGESLTLTCVTSASFPTSTVTWSGLPSGTTPTVREETTSGVLVKTTSSVTFTVSRNDDGNVIQCVASNINGQSSPQSKRAVLEVWYLDIPVLTIDKLEVMENSTVNLDCSVGSNPTVDMTIKNIDNDTVVVQRNTNTLSYTIQRVQCLHNGTYVCSADQKTTGLIYTNNKELNVLCPPRQDNRQPYIETIGSGLNQVASFVASVISNPAPTFKWFTYINNQLIPIPNLTVHVIITSDQQSILQITVSHNRDYGRYAASVENNLGKLQILFTLSPVSSPLSPDKMSVGNKTSTSISLRWKSNYNGGSEQTFSVQFQTSENVWRLWEEGILDPGQGMWLNTAITDLRPDTQYNVQVYSRNIYGESEKVVREAKTQSVQKQETSERLEDGIVIGIGIGIAVSLPIIIGLIIALVVFLRRRSPKTEGNTISTDNELQVRNQQNNDIPSTYTHLKTDNQTGNEYEKINVPTETTDHPTITSVPFKKDVTENRKPNIDCSSNIIPGNPSSTSYRWTGPGGYSKTGAVLDRTVTRTQGGQYTCTATNTAGLSDTATVNINVQCEC